MVELPGPVLAELKGDRKRLEELLLHHVAVGSVASCQMQDNTHLATATDSKVYYKCSTYKYADQVVVFRSQVVIYGSWLLLMGDGWWVGAPLE